MTMSMLSHSAFRTYFLLFALACAGAARAEVRKIDSQNSVITVRVSKAGVFSFLAHNHVIRASGVEGTAETEGSPRVEFKLNARRLKVVDPGTSDKERAEIQQAMEEKVLEIGKYPEVSFVSRSVNAQKPARWEVRGDLSLHGRTRPISFVVQESEGRYRGKLTLRQTDFGIQPVRVAGGTVSVKDEITIEFDVRMELPR